MRKIITKADLFLDKSHNINSHQDFLLNWDDVEDYFWSVNKRPPDPTVPHVGPGSQFRRDFKKWKDNVIFMWSYDYTEALRAKHATFKKSMHSHTLVLNLKFSDGKKARLNESSPHEQTELQMVRNLLSHNAYAAYLKSIPEKEQPF